MRTKLTTFYPILSVVTLFYSFQEKHSFKRTLRVQVVDKGCLTIEFYSNREQRAENMLCRLEMELPPPTKDPEVKASEGKS